MPAETIEERLTSLEQKVALLTSDHHAKSDEAQWWDSWFGVFRDDPYFDNAVKFGADYRKSQPSAADSIREVEL